MSRRRGSAASSASISCPVRRLARSSVSPVILLPATEHAPVHIADVITAFGKLRKLWTSYLALAGTGLTIRAAGPDDLAAAHALQLST